MSCTLSILIVSYNSVSELPMLSRDVAQIAARIPRCEVLVWDNASTDRTAGLLDGALPIATVVKSDENVGFGAAVNMLAERARGDILFLLNPDCSVSSGTVSRMLDAFSRDSRIVMASPAIENAGMKALGGGYEIRLRSAVAFSIFMSRIFPERTFSRGIFAYTNRRAGEIDLVWLAGTALFVWRTDFVRCGGFDSRFFLYGEDVDLGIRMARQGGRHVMMLHERAYHQGAASVRKSAISSNRWAESLAQVYEVHHGRGAGLRAFAAILAFGYYLRWLFASDWASRQLYLGAAATYRRIAWAEVISSRR